MFGFLKEKLKNALKKFSKDVEEETQPVEEVKTEIKVPEMKKPQQKVSEKKVEKKTEKKPETKAKHEVKHKVKKVKEEIKTAIKEKAIEEKVTEEAVVEEKKGFFARLKETFVGKEIKEEKPEKKVEQEKLEIPTPEVKEIIVPELKETPEKKELKEEEEKKEKGEGEEEEKAGFFAKLAEVVTKKTLTEEKFDELFFELEVILLESNVAVEVIDLLKENLKGSLVNQKVLRGKVADVIQDALKKTVDEIFSVETIDLVRAVQSKKEKPYVVVFFGINGSGKTTTIGKLAHLLKKKGLRCCIAAADTFRAAAIQQIEEHANNVGVKLIKHDYGSDPAAVGFDAIKYAQAKGLDCVLIDTAGRLHSNKDLVREMEKIVRVTKPDLKVFVGEAITGNDCVEQARQFNDAVGIDGIILAKADVDEKGGAALSVTRVTGKPILYLGVGQGYDDLEMFDKDKVMKNIL